MLTKKQILTLLLLLSFFVPSITFATSEQETLEECEPTEDIMEEELQMREVPITNYIGYINDIMGLHGLRGEDTPKEMNPAIFDFKNIMTSLFANSHLYYGIRINKSRFAFCPGVAYESACYVLPGERRKHGEKTHYKYHGFSNKTSNKIILKDARELVPEHENIDEVIRSTAKINYLVGLLEFRFNTVLDEPKEGFWLAGGMRFGMPTNTTTTIQYKRHGNVEKTTSNLNLPINKWLWGIQGRLGYNRFGVCYKHTFSPLFEDKKGPSSTTTKPWSISFCIDLA